MEPIVYELKEPFNFGTDKITKVSLQPMKAKHLRAMKGEGMSDMLDLLGKLAGLTREEVDELGSEDAVALLEIVAGFLGRGPRAGEKSTQP